METIQNDILSVSVDLHGGALCGVYDKISGRELMWQGAENSWKGHDVVIFPFIARLKNKTYTLGGKPYTLDNHGVARYSELKVHSKSATAVTLVLRADAYTLARYPYDFALYVTYALDGDRLTVSYRVDNLTDRTMYFALGGHPAYNIGCTPSQPFDDITGNFVEFDAPVKAVRYVLDEKGEFIIGVTDPAKLTRIELDKKLFRKHKTLIFGGTFNGVSLITRDGGRLDFVLNGAPYLGLWSFDAHGGFACIEPWWGLPDFTDCDSELSKKPGINVLGAKKSFEYSYSVKYNIK